MARRVNVRALTAHANGGGTRSLRKLELALLEKRREVGVILKDLGVVQQMQEVFGRDRALTGIGRRELKRAKREKKDEKVAHASEV